MLASAVQARDLRHVSLKRDSRVVDLGCRLAFFKCKAGDGETFPRAGDRVRIYFTGMLVDDNARLEYVGIRPGSAIDRSSLQGRPVEFTLGSGQVIQGLEEGLPSMSLGEQAVMRIPAGKGDGAVASAGGRMPRDRDLYFEVQLVAINGTESPRAAPEQGFSGKSVSHDGMTCIEDWRREYGPKMGESGPCTDGKKQKEPMRSDSGALRAYAWTSVAVAFAAGWLHG